MCCVGDLVMALQEKNVFNYWFHLKIIRTTSYSCSQRPKKAMEDMEASGSQRGGNRAVRNTIFSVLLYCKSSSTFGSGIMIFVLEVGNVITSTCD
jgi:hypothetical protein